MKHVIAAAVLGLTATVAQGADIVLNKDVIVLRGEVNSKSVADVSLQIMQAEGDITLFLSSPGGSVVDGAALIQVMQASGKNITCITDFSASMSFVILQACTTRIVMNNSVAMAHPMTYGIQGQQEYQVDTFNNFIKDIGLDINTMVAKRIGITVEKLKEDSRSDLWLYGARAVKYGAADAVKSVTCSPELAKGTVAETVQMFGVNINVLWSACPLIANPLKVSAQGVVREEFFKIFVNFRHMGGKGK